MQYLQLLHMKLPCFPRGRVIETERPDFLVEAPAATIGVEITEICESPERRKEVEEQRICEKARDLYAKSGLPPLIATIHFANAKLRKGLCDRIASQLAECVVASHAKIPTGGSVFIEELPDNCADFVDAVHVLLSPHATFEDWSVSRVGWIATTFEDELQANIDRKQSKLSEYLGKCSQCWLVVGASGREPSSFYEMSSSMKEGVFYSDFSRVFFVQLFEGTLVELHVARSQRSDGET